MTKRTMTDEEFEEYFDNGGDITGFMVQGSLGRPNLDNTPRKINISMPEWMIGELDATAKRFGITRQAVINIWIGERLQVERRAAV